MGSRDAPVDDHEQALVDRARLGDRAAFDRLVETHLPRVWRVVWRILRHAEDTEDVVQEVFLAAFRTLPAFRGDARFSTWLHRIAVSRALNHLDRAGERLRRRSEPLEPPSHEDGEPAEVLLPSPGESPLQALERRELARRLAECFNLLPSPWQAVLTLREGEGLSYDDLAKILEVNIGTVRSRLARARVALRDCVTGKEE